MERLERQLEEERLVAELSRELAGRSAEAIADGIRRALREAARLARADRAYLVAFPGPGKEGGDIERFEWVDEGISRRPPGLPLGEARENFPWLAACMRRGEIVSWSGETDLQGEAARERERLRELGVRSCIVMPARIDGEPMGVIGFESHRESRVWDDGEIGVLRLVAGLLSGVLRRKRDEQARAETQRRLERQLALEKQLADLSRHFVDLEPDELESGIRQKLPDLAALAGAEHISLFAIQHPAVPVRDSVRVYEWWADGTPVAVREAASRRADFRYALRSLGRGEVYHVPDPSTLPPEAVAERADLQSRGVRSQLSIPIFSERRLVGSLTVECMSHFCEWSEEVITLLRLAGEILAGVLRRVRVAQDLAESQTRLLQSQKMEAVGTLAGGIAHDFNNQLAVMLGNARFVLEALKDRPDLAEALMDIERAAEHCARLTDGLLAFSRRSPVEERPLDVRGLLYDVQGLVAPLLPASIRLEVRIAREAGWIRGDAVQLQQVLINLIVNARDAMPDGGRLTLSARPRALDAESARVLGLGTRGTYVEIRVRDTGAGMSPAVASRIFEPFFTTKQVGAGTGLGLATAYGIVQQSGGVITVESQEGKGSTFHVLLPATSERPVAEGEPCEDGRLEGNGRVLLVEDEPAVRRVVERMLSGLGFRVLEAADGDEGLRLGRAHVHELVLLITDLTMPGLAGPELARRLAEQRPELPVLFLSGYSDGRAESAAASLSRAGYLRKPFDARDLEQRVRELIAPGRDEGVGDGGPEAAGG